MRQLLNLICSFCLLFIGSIEFGYAQEKKILFSTAYGDFKVMLYDFTPQHRDLFIQCMNDGVYREALFNRVIKNFVVQGGEHDIDIELRETLHHEMPKHRFPAEFDSRAIHRLGALGAGRDGNPEKASFLNQIYFVVGKEVRENDLDEIAKKKNIVYTEDQIRTYLEIGGQPRLDQDYTVFGEVYEGIEVLLRIAKANTDQLDFPLEEIPFQLYMIEE